jgi:hypothetical protein
VEGCNLCFFGRCEEAAVAVPCADGVIVCGRTVGDNVAGVFEIERANALAGALDGVDVTGLENEGDGLGEVDAGIFKATVDEERDGNQAGSGGLGEFTGPLVDADGAGNLVWRFDFVGLGSGVCRY